MKKYKENFGHFSYLVEGLRLYLGLPLLLPCHLFVCLFVFIFFFILLLFTASFLSVSLPSGKTPLLSRVCTTKAESLFLIDFPRKFFFYHPSNMLFLHNCRKNALIFEIFPTKKYSSKYRWTITTENQIFCGVSAEKLLCRFAFSFLT